MKLLCCHFLGVSLETSKNLVIYALLALLSLHSSQYRQCNVVCDVNTRSSQVQKRFEFYKKDGKLDKSLVVCNHCGAAFKYSGQVT